MNINFIDYLNSCLTKEEITILSSDLFNSFIFEKEEKYIVKLGDIYHLLSFKNIVEAQTFIEKNFVNEQDYIYKKYINDYCETDAKDDLTISNKCLIDIVTIINTEESYSLLNKYNKFQEINCKYIFTKYKYRDKIFNAENKEKMLINSFTENIQGIYWIINPVLNVCKFGSSKNIYNRWKCHKKYLGKDFFLDNVIETDRYIELENTIRKHVNATYKKYTEIIMYKDYKELKKKYIETEIQNKMLESGEIYKSYTDMYNKQIKLNLLEKKNKETELDILKCKVKLEKINKFSIVETYNPLYDFLSLNTRYKHGGILLMESIREKFNLWASKDLTKLNNYIFKEVNKEYIVETVSLCKKCWKPGKKGCCPNYINENRTSKKIVRNIEFYDNNV